MHPEYSGLFFLNSTEWKGIAVDEAEIARETENLEDFSGMFKKRHLLPLLKALGLSVIIFALAGGISLALPMLPQMVVVILSITTLAILASLIKSINRLKRHFSLECILFWFFHLQLLQWLILKQCSDIGC